MKNIRPLDILLFLFISLFMYAATNKLMDYELFRAQIGKSPLILDYSNWIAWVIPVLEIVISLMLLISRMQLIGLFAFYTLMLIFTLYILFILNFSPYVPCSCGGILSSMGWTAHLIFNGCFTFLSIIAVALHDKNVVKA